MIRKEHIFTLALLASLPGCGDRQPVEPRHKESTHKPSGNDEFVMVEMPLAEDDKLAEAEVDESVKSYFDEDVNELVVVEPDGKESDSDTFAWIEASPDEEQAFETVYFEYDRRRPDEAQKDRVKINVTKAKELIDQAHAEGKSAMLVVEGHACHSAGSAAYNLAISEDRAKTLTDQLVSAGIPRAHIKVVGRGKEMPATHRGKAVTGDRQDQWRNRRVEMNVIYS